MKSKTNSKVIYLIMAVVMMLSLLPAMTISAAPSGKIYLGSKADFRCLCQWLQYGFTSCRRRLRIDRRHRYARCFNFTIRLNLQAHSTVTGTLSRSLKIAGDSTIGYGLFSSIDGGTVKGLWLESVAITATKEDVPVGRHRRDL